MKTKNKVCAALTLAMFVASLVLAAAAPAITIKEEQELSKEFMKMVAERFPIIDDPMIVDYVNKVGRRILATVPPQPFYYHFYVIQEETYNAFASPGGHIFINSGLLVALENEEELAGIIGHEISHVVCRHISQRIERSKKINIAAMAGMVAGIFLGVGGAAAAGNATAIGAMAAGQSAALSYSREDERQADEIGLQYLVKSGYGGNGLLSSLNKIRSQQWFGTDQIPGYLLTHPASEDRIAYIDGWLERHRKSTGAVKSEKHADTTEFDRIHTRVTAKYSESSVALAKFKNMIAQNPDNAMAHYGMGMLFSRMGNQVEAADHLKKALELSALDPYFLMELGQVYFAQGRYENAVTTLKSALGMATDVGGKFSLGRAQMELGNLNEAVDILEQVVKEKKDYNIVYYYLGEAYGKLEKMGEAHFNLGRYYFSKQDVKNTHFHLGRALKLLQDPQKRGQAQEMLAQMPKLRNVAPE